MSENDQETKKKFSLMEVRRMKKLGYSNAEIAESFDPPMKESTIKTLTTKVKRAGKDI